MSWAFHEADEQHCKPASHHTLPPRVALKENLLRVQLPCVLCLQLMSQICSQLQGLQKSHGNSPYNKITQIYQRELEIRGKFPGAPHLPAVTLLAVSYAESPGLAFSLTMNFTFNHSKNFASQRCFSTWGCSGNETLMGVWERRSPPSCCR